MLYIIYGDNIERKKKAQADIGRADIVINLETENREQKISEAINMQSLWGDNLTITLDRVLDDKDIKDIIYENLEEIKNSDNKFVIEETKINAAVLSKVSKYATKVYDCSIGEIVNNRGNNRVPEKSPFKLCDYIAARDKKNAWLELMRLYDTDIESEPLHGAIWWKLKIGWPMQGPSTSTFDFIMISLRAHNGECDFRNEMERWVLNIQ